MISTDICYEHKLISELKTIIRHSHASYVLNEILQKIYVYLRFNVLCWKV